MLFRPTARVIATIFIPSLTTRSISHAMMTTPTAASSSSSTQTAAAATTTQTATAATTTVTTPTSMTRTMKSISSFYKRELPESCIGFSSPRGKEIFKSALQQGGLKSFFCLMEQHVTQSELAFCGISTLVIVLNAFAIDPKQSWKGGGPWRWYYEDLLDCCSDLEKIKVQGITLSDFACLAICQGLSVDVRYAEQADNHGSLEHFRIAVRQACIEEEDEPEKEEEEDDDDDDDHDSQEVVTHGDNATKNERTTTTNDTTTSSRRGTNGDNYNNNNKNKEEEEKAVMLLRHVLVVSYDRKTLGQTGSGHFSPLAAYDPSSDCVLILDTARFKYGAHWIPLSLLHSAMIPHDPATGRSRGFAILSCPNHTNNDNNDPVVKPQLQGHGSDPLFPLSMLFRYKPTDDAQRHLADFYSFLNPRDSVTTTAATSTAATSASGDAAGGGAAATVATITWDKVYNYWTKGGTEPLFIWQMIQPQFKPLDDETRTHVNNVIAAIQRLLPFAASTSTTTTKGSGTDDINHTKMSVPDSTSTTITTTPCRRQCRPNHARTLPLHPIEAIFIIFLSVLDKKDRREFVMSASSSSSSSSLTMSPMKATDGLLLLSTSKEDDEQLGPAEEQLLVMAEVVRTLFELATTTTTTQQSSLLSSISSSSSSG